jgi:hypothetical protein
MISHFSKNPLAHIYSYSYFQRICSALTKEYSWRPKASRTPILELSIIGTVLAGSLFLSLCDNNFSVFDIVFYIPAE